MKTAASKRRTGLYISSEELGEDRDELARVAKATRYTESQVVAILLSLHRSKMAADLHGFVGPQLSLIPEATGEPPALPD